MAGTAVAARLATDGERERGVGRASGNLDGHCSGPQPAGTRSSISRVGLSNDKQQMPGLDPPGNQAQKGRQDLRGNDQTGARENSRYARAAGKSEGDTR